jgi:predicted dehydrogenase
MKVREFIPAPARLISQLIDERWPDDFWGNDPHVGGGNVLSQGCHVADLLCHLAGSEPVKLHSVGGNFHHPGLDVTDVVAATVTFASGAAGSLVIGDVGKTPFVSKFSVQVMDGKRTAHLHDRLKKAVMWDGEREIHHEDDDEVGVEEENKEFISVLNGTRPLRASVSDGIRATVLLLRALESIRCGQPQPASL